VGKKGRKPLDSLDVFHLERLRSRVATGKTTWQQTPMTRRNAFFFVWTLSCLLASSLEAHITDFAVDKKAVLAAEGVTYLDQLIFDDTVSPDALFLGETVVEATEKLRELARAKKVEWVVVEAKRCWRSRNPNTSPIRFDLTLAKYLFWTTECGYGVDAIAILGKADLAEIERIENELLLVNLNRWYGALNPFGSKTHYGVFANKDYEEGTLFFEYRGIVGHSWDGLYAADLIKDSNDKDLVVDAGKAGNLSRFVNDSPTPRREEGVPNVKLVHVLKANTGDKGRQGYSISVYLMAERKILAGEQLFFGYGHDYWKGLEGMTGMKPANLFVLDYLIRTHMGGHLAIQSGDLSQ
jgi:hypothetical protein